QFDVHRVGAANQGVEKAQEDWRQARTRAFDHGIPLSVSGILSSLFSVTLLSSDDPRSGLGSRTAPFDRLQPSVYRAYGPWAYPVYTVYSNETAKDIRVWTLIQRRSAAIIFNVSSYPHCMIDDTPYEDEHFRRATRFQMTDELVNASARGGNPSAFRVTPHSRTMRAKASFGDRVHDHVLAQALTRPHTTTIRAVYYPPELVASRQAINFSRPSANVLCHGMWANFARIHGREDVKYVDTGHVASNISERVQKMKQNHAKLVIDMLVLSQAEDARVSAGGIEHESIRYDDVTMIMRVRDCDKSNQLCSTNMIDDFRYESGTYVMDGNEWYIYVATLRPVGQTYRTSTGVFQEEQYRDESWWIVTRATVRTLCLIPCQGIVFGSMLSTACYVLVHLIDAPMGSEALHNKLVTSLGFDNPDSRSISKVCQFGAIQMRNIWLLELCLQLAVWMQTSRNWSPADGVRGLPEYAMSILSAVTLLATYRGTNHFRFNPIHQVMETAERDHRGRASFSTFDSLDAMA
ncbi:TPA: LOW QUALITY PROTEIN: hypothetical protein N0F65_003553, partial [Lagenidium giganteum]